MTVLSICLKEITAILGFQLLQYILFYFIMGLYTRIYSYKHLTNYVIFSGSYCSTSFELMDDAL